MDTAGTIRHSNPEPNPMTATPASASLTPNTEKERRKTDDELYALP